MSGVKWKYGNTSAILLLYDGFRTKIRVVISSVHALGREASPGEGGGPFLIPDSGPPGWRALAILCAWLAVLGITAFWRFQQRDIQE